MSFECPHCGFTNNEVQSAGRIQDKGCTITLSVSSPKVQYIYYKNYKNIVDQFY